MIKNAVSLLKNITRDLVLSFDLGENTITKLYFNHKVRVDKIRSIVMKNVTNDSTVTPANSTGNMANGVVTIAAGSAKNVEDSSVPITNNIIEKDSYVQLTSFNATGSGRVLVSLELTIM